MASPEPESAVEASEPAPIPDRWDRTTWAWLLLVLAVASPLLLVGLGGGTMRMYDEGLYGKLARNALEYGQYLYPVDREGEFFEAFSKPPLTIAVVAASFDTLGVSLFALRLPFALCMLASIGVVFAWGRRIAGLPFGVAWAGVLLFAVASVRWGRAACIEPMLMLWIVLGSWAYHEASLRRGPSAWAWALVAALGLALAVATKQVVVGLAVGPIVALEVWRWRWREALPRLLLVLGLPAAVGLGWLWMVVARLGDSAIEIYVNAGVLQRMQGYREGQGQRTLNELSGVVSEASEPFPWVLGVAGLVMLVLMRPVSRRTADGALLLPLLLVTAVLVFENLSSSMLPWYAHDLVVPLTGGLGFLIAGLVGPTDDRLGVMRAVGGALALGVGAVGALALVVSQLDVALVVGLLVVVAWRVGTPWSARIRVGLLAAAALAFVGGAVMRPELRAPPSGHEQLMQMLAARGIQRVDVDSNSGITSENGWATYYGPLAEKVSRPPWRARSDAEAYVTGSIWPTELEPDNDSELVHVPGLMAVVGDLKRPPWGRRTLNALLDRGPLTFEAEHLPSQNDDTVKSDPRASGGQARAVPHSRGAGRPSFLLGHGPGHRLPAGKYSADFMMRWGCEGIFERTAVIVQVLVKRKVAGQKELICTGEEPGEYEAVSVDFTLRKPDKVELWVRYVWGEVWYDHVVVRRE